MLQSQCAFLKRVLVIVLGFCLNGAVEAAGVPAEAVTNRCGWYDNPTPGNATLLDKDGEWTLGLQGEYTAKGDWSPPFDGKSSKRFVSHGMGSYGHGCVCIRAKVDQKTMRISEVFSVTIKELRFCRKDKKLKEPINPLDDVSG